MPRKTLVALKDDDLEEIIEDVVGFLIRDSGITSVSDIRPEEEIRKGGKRWVGRLTLL